MDVEYLTENLEEVQENLLEPSGEVSFAAREDNPDAIDDVKKVSVTLIDVVKTPSTLTDDRAKVLHLQRVQKSEDIPTEPEDGDEAEKEETLNLSLDSIIRRGLGQQKINTNFQKEFPEFSSGEEAAERLSTLLTRTPLTVKSQRDAENADNDGENVESEIENEASDGAEYDFQISQHNEEAALPQPKKRGRPPKFKGILKKPVGIPKRRGRPKSMANVSFGEPPSGAEETQLDRLMSLGHSIFSDCGPKKRGRKPKQQMFEQSFDTENVGTSYDAINSEHDDSGMNGSAYSHEPFILNGQPKIYKKRGRKPKSYYLQLQQQQENGSFDTSDVNVSQASVDDRTPVVANHIGQMPRKRGRPPKNPLQHHYHIATVSDTSASITIDYEDIKQERVTPRPGDDSFSHMPKKRGRKPKSFYIQQQQQQYMASAAPPQAPIHAADMHESSPSQAQSFRDESDSTNNFIGFSASESSAVEPPAKKKRGRKPKGYYEALAQQAASGDVHGLATVRPMVTLHSSLARLPGHVPKKRGRKPKSYYLQLQQQQQQQNGSFGGSMENHSTPIQYFAESANSIIHSPDTSAIDSHTNGILKHKRVPVPNMKRYDIGQTPRFKTDKIQLFPKKRGRKPKNYVPENGMLAQLLQRQLLHNAN